MIDPLILARSVHLAATVLAAGTVCFMVLVAEPAARTMTAPRPADLPGVLRAPDHCGLHRARARHRFGRASGWCLIAADIYGVADRRSVPAWRGRCRSSTDTRFGQVAIARLALALLIAALLPGRHRGWLQLAAAIGLIALPALIGHAGATPGLAGPHPSRVRHGASAGGRRLARRPAGAGHAAGAARRSGKPAWRAFASRCDRAVFDRSASSASAALLASGIVNSWNLLAGPRDLVATDYGRLVLLKIGLFAAMVAIAAVNRYHLTPRLPAPAAMRALRRNSLAETGLGLCVLVFVGGARHHGAGRHVHAPPADIPPDAAFVHIHTNEAMADVTIEPGRPGPVRVSIRLTREDSSDIRGCRSLGRARPRGHNRARHPYPAPQHGCRTEHGRSID